VQTLLYQNTTRQLQGWFSYYSGGVVNTACAASGTPVLVAATLSFASGYPSGASVGISAWMGPNADNKDDALPLLIVGSVSGAYAASIGNAFRKGFTTLTRVVGQPSRMTGSRYSTNTAYDGIVVSGCVLPWDGSTVFIP